MLMHNPSSSGGGRKNLALFSCELTHSWPEPEGHLQHPVVRLELDGFKVPFQPKSFQDSMILFLQRLAVEDIFRAYTHTVTRALWLI